MNRSLWIVVILAISVACGGKGASGRQDVSGRKGASATAVEQELRALDVRWAELAVRGDLDAFDQLVSEDHIATHANGNLVTNAEEKAYIVKSPTRLAAITTDEVAVRVYGDTAVILGIVSVKSRKGNIGRYRYTTTWLKRGDRWRLIAEQHTKIEPPAPPVVSSGGRTPEQVVRAYAQACNDFDLPAFVALHSPDVKKFSRVEQMKTPAPDKLPAEFVLTTSGRDEVERKYQRVFDSTPRTVRVEIVSVFAIGDVVVSRDRVTGFPDGHIADELTLYQVRDGLVQNIWYLQQTSH